jgi:hypothetical protein
MPQLTAQGHPPGRRPIGQVLVATKGGWYRGVMRRREQSIVAGRRGRPRRDMSRLSAVEVVKGTNVVIGVCAFVDLAQSASCQHMGRAAGAPTRGRSGQHTCLRDFPSSPTLARVTSQRVSPRTQRWTQHAQSQTLPTHRPGPESSSRGAPCSAALWAGLHRLPGKGSALVTAAAIRDARKGERGAGSLPGRTEQRAGNPSRGLAGRGTSRTQESHPEEPGTGICDGGQIGEEKAAPPLAKSQGLVFMSQ